MLAVIATLCGLVTLAAMMGLMTLADLMAAGAKKRPLRALAYLSPTRTSSTLAWGTR